MREEKFFEQPSRNPSEAESDVFEHPESELKVVATGGLARYIMQETSLVDHYDEDLGLKGLQIIAHANMAEPYKIAI